MHLNEHFHSDLAVVVYIYILLLPSVYTLYLGLGDSKIYSTVRFSSPYHMEIDEQDPSRLIASFYSSLGYVTEHSSDPYAIVGNGDGGYQDGYKGEAKFRTIRGFRQINRTHVLLADYDNYCVRLVNRITSQTSTAAGVCEDWEYIDGPLRTAQFYRPVNIIDGFTEGSFLVTDHHNCAIRDVNLNTGVVSTFSRDEEKIYFPIDMVYDEHTSRLYVTLRFKVVYINRHTKEVTDLFEHEPDKIILFHPNLLLMTKNPEVGTDIIMIEARGNDINHTSLLGGDWSGEAAKSIVLNSTRNLYVAERRVVRSIPVVDSDKPPTPPSTTVKPTTILVTHPLLISESTHTQLSTEGKIVNRGTTLNTKTSSSTTVAQDIQHPQHEASPTALMVTGIAVSLAAVGLVVVGVVVCRGYMRRRKNVKRRRLKSTNSTASTSPDQSDNRMNETKGFIEQWLDQSDPSDPMYDSVSIRDESPYTETDFMSRPQDDERSSCSSWVDVSKQTHPAAYLSPCASHQENKKKGSNEEDNKRNEYTPQVNEFTAVHPTQESGYFEDDYGENYDLELNMPINSLPTLQTSPDEDPSDAVEEREGLFPNGASNTSGHRMRIESLDGLWCSNQPPDCVDCL